MGSGQLFTSQSINNQLLKKCLLNQSHLRGASGVADSGREGSIANGEQAVPEAVESATEAQAGTPDLAAAAQAAAAFQAAMGIQASV